MNVLSLVSVLDLHDFVVLSSDIDVLKLVYKLTIVGRGLVLELAELALVLRDLRLDVPQIARTDAPAISLRRCARALRLSLRRRCFGCRTQGSHDSLVRLRRAKHFLRRLPRVSKH